MGEALYRKYRSKTLEEVVGQDHITATLRNALAKGNISHAYLFTGPRGTGKTSIARILAHEVNKLPYDQEPHLDIIEIDAASNRRIDEIRELRERVYVAPASARYKVYIIDEVHMLTKEAFNALLKTLEEPPAHVIFILATTESHKLPATIISRTQRFQFKPIQQADAFKHLDFIAKKEHIQIDKPALQLISQHADGSFRDAISLLDQASGLSEEVTAEHIQHMLGIPHEEVINGLIEALESSDGRQMITQLQGLLEQGILATHVAKQLARTLKQELVSGRYAGNLRVHSLLMDLLDVPTAYDPFAKLELILLGHIPSTPHHARKIPENFEAENSATPESVQPHLTQDPEAEAPQETQIDEEQEVITPVIERGVLPHDSALEASGEYEDESMQPATKTSDQDDSWIKLLHDLKREHSTLHGVVRMAKPEFFADNVTLAFRFPFHKKRLDDQRNKEILSKLIYKHFDKNTTLNVTLASVSADAPQSKNSLEAINSVFGSTELLP